MAKCLVTGGAGFIGSHLVRGLLSQKHTVRVFDNYSSGKRENLYDVASKIDLFEGDLRYPEEILRACKDMDIVFHLAAIPSVPVSIDNPTDSHDANVSGTFNVLQSAVQQKCKRVVYAGSSSAYGDTRESPKHEGLLPAPLSPYAVQKLTGEHYCRAFYECWGLETITLRYFNVFGPRQDPTSDYAAAIPAFVTAIMDGKSPTVFGDGEQTRDFTYIDNVVLGNLLAAKMVKTEGQVVNVACGERITVNEVVNTIGEFLGRGVRPVYKPPRPGDVKHSTADIQLARKLLGYKPKVGFAQGLSKAIEFYKTQTT